MRCKHFFAVLSGLVAVALLAADASAMYHPTLGRWLQRDPIGYAAGGNLLEYVSGNPSLSVDPLGLGAVDWLIRTIKGAVSAIGDLFAGKQSKESKEKPSRPCAKEGEKGGYAVNAVVSPNNILDPDEVNEIQRQGKLFVDLMTVNVDVIDTAGTMADVAVGVSERASRSVALQAVAKVSNFYSLAPGMSDLAQDLAGEVGKVGAKAMNFRAFLWVKIQCEVCECETAGGKLVWQEDGAADYHRVQFNDYDTGTMYPKKPPTISLYANDRSASEIGAAVGAAVKEVCGIE